jgi:hypothetical protein
MADAGAVLNAFARAAAKASPAPYGMKIRPGLVQNCPALLVMDDASWAAIPDVLVLDAVAVTTTGLRLPSSP